MTSTSDTLSKKVTKDINSLHTGLCRRYMNGALDQDTIDRCNRIPNWNWDIHDTCETLDLDQILWSLVRTLGPRTTWPVLE